MGKQVSKFMHLPSSLKRQVSDIMIVKTLMFEAWEVDRHLTTLHLLLALGTSVCRYTQICLDASIVTHCIAALHDPSAFSRRGFSLLILLKLGVICFLYGLDAGHQPVEKRFVASLSKARHLKLLGAFCGLDFSEQVKEEVLADFDEVFDGSNSAASFIRDILEAGFRIGEMCVSLISISWGLTKFSPLLVTFSTALIVANVTNFLFAATEHQQTWHWHYRSSQERKASALGSFLFSGKDAARDVLLHKASPWLLKTYDENADTFSYASVRKANEPKADAILGVLQLLEAIGIPMLAIANGDSLQLHSYNLAQKQLSSICRSLSSLRTTMHITGRIMVPFGEKYIRCLSMAKRKRLSEESPAESVTSIEVRNVSYSYNCQAQIHEGQSIFANESDSPSPTTDHLEQGNAGLKIGDGLALRNFSFRFETGKIYSIVGKNGSGKSTLIGLLTKLLSPASGKILVNGVDLEKLLIDDWLEKLAVVPQTFAELSECTVRENIGLGATSLLLQDPESVIDGEAVALGIKEFVELETYLGDEGRSRDISGKEKWQKNLSGGQMQCIALARAFVRKSAEVLIFDEPSSNLDPEAEHKLFKRLWKEKNNRITIFVSHRLQTCRSSDCIIVMDQGSILQAGTHSELMVDTNGRYAKLTALQAAY